MNQNILFCVPDDILRSNEVTRLVCECSQCSETEHHLRHYYF